MTQIQFIDQHGAGLLFEKYALLNGVKVPATYRGQRMGIDVYQVPGAPPMDLQWWLVYEVPGDKGEPAKKTEIALGMIRNCIQNGWDGQPESEMRSLMEFFSINPAVPVIRWSTFLASVAMG